MIYRAIRSRLRTESKFNMPWLFLYSGLAIPGFYAVGLLARTESHLTVAEFWRFWVVHLWVEDFLELFTTVMVAYIFVMLGVVRRQIAIICSMTAGERRFPKTIDGSRRRRIATGSGAGGSG